MLSTVLVYGQTIVYIFYYWEHEPSLRILQAILLLELLPSYILQRNFRVIEFVYLQLHEQIPIIESSGANLHSHKQCKRIPLLPHTACGDLNRYGPHRLM